MRLRIEVVERILQKVKTSVLPVCGLLIGHSESPLDTEVTDLLPVEEKGVLEEKLADIERAKEAIRLERGENESVLGFYRSTAESELRLREEDLTLMRAQFAGPADICLLVKPSQDGVSTAGFFFWDNGAIEPGFSFNEFPFEPETLRAEILAQQRLATQEELPAEADVPAQSGGRAHRKRFLWMAAACIFVCVAAVLAYRALALLPVHSDNGTSLALRVVRQGEDWRVSWDRNAPVLKNSDVRGKLTISENESVMREILLRHEDLRDTGSIVYVPLSQRVEFRLEMTGQGATATETVLAIRGLPLSTGKD